MDSVPRDVSPVNQALGTAIARLGKVPGRVHAQAAPRFFHAMQTLSLRGAGAGARRIPTRNRECARCAGAAYAAGTYSSGAPGPIGRPSESQIANSTVQPIANTTEYGSITEITVPMPAFGS